MQTVPEKVYKVAVARAQEMDVKNAISSACIEVEKLAEKVSEVRKQMMESNDNYTSLEELCHQATAVSNSGKKLSLLKNAISIKGLDDTRATLFNDYQPTILHLEPIRLASQNLSSSNSLVPAADQVFLDQPQFPVDEASTSGSLNFRLTFLPVVTCSVFVSRTCLLFNELFIYFICFIYLLCMLFVLF